MTGNDRPADAVRIELLASVFATLAPALIMSGLFAAIGAIVSAASGDVALRGLYAIGMVASVARMAAMLRFRRSFVHGVPSVAEAGAIERRFAATYITFALSLGLFAACAYAVSDNRMATIVVTMVVGYAAGVSAGVALRPRISIPSMVLAVAPVTATAAATGGFEGAVLALTLGGFLAGGLRSTSIRYRAAIESAAARHMLATLARTDPLTGVANRLALTERLQDAVRAGTALSLHYVDLDDFKLVNDRYGHLAGDAVLIEAAARLRRLCGHDGIAARLGGDEFILARPVAAGRTGAATMRIEFAMAEPFLVHGEPMLVGASVGETVMEPSEEPAEALARADRALYAAKHGRAGNLPPASGATPPPRHPYLVRARR